jgi:hypothetical protein
VLNESRAEPTCSVESTNSKTVLNGLEARRLDGCFGGKADVSPVSKRVLAITACTPATRGELDKLREQLVGATREINDDLLSSLGTAAPDWAEAIHVLRSELTASQVALAETDGIAETTLWEWGPSGHQLFQEADGAWALDYVPVVEARCAVGSDACAFAATTAASLNRSVNLTRYVLRCAGQARLEGTRTKLAELDADWDHYFFETRSQFIWELAINSARFNADNDKFAGPPDDQIILLHPGIAVEYVGGGEQNESAYDFVIMTELIGYNRIRWPNRRHVSPSRLPALGAAVVATYTPDNTGDRVGYGLMVHINHKYSVGATRRDTGAGEETTWLLSVDLMRLLLKPSYEDIKNFRGAGASNVP